MSSKVSRECGPGLSHHDVVERRMTPSEAREANLDDHELGLRKSP